MPNYLRFHDAVDLKVAEVSKETRDYFSANTGTQLLRVRIAATHSGKITRNNGFYLPHKMRDGATSFTAQYPKPIQIHHDSYQDPIGRVLSAHYVDTSGGFRKTIQNKINDSVVPISLLDAFIEGKLSPSDAIKVANKYFIQDLAVSEDPDYEGLGYVELIAGITEPDAIQKILDGRYLTGSVGASTNSAVCSITKCRKDWASGNMCEHKPGKIYDGERCVLIAGDLFYDEYSFVNKPADRHSKVIEINVNGVRDFVHIPDQEWDGVPEIRLTDSPREEPRMLFKQAMDIVAGNEAFAKVPDFQDHIKVVVDTENELTPENFVEKLAAYLKAKGFEVATSEAKPAEPGKDGAQEEQAPASDPVRVALGDEYDDIVGDDAWGKQYAQMLADALTGVMKGENEEDLAPLMKDAKLDAASRKKLSSSTFCGPNRSYPVPDCAHAKSAMAYAKKYNESSSVMACIMRKASRLGCPFSGGKKDSVQEELPVYDVAYFDAYSDEHIRQLDAALRLVIKERALTCGCEQTKKEELDALVLEAHKKVEDDYKKKVVDLESRLESARKESKYLHEDISNLIDSSTKMTVEMRGLYASRIKDYRVLANDSVSDALEEKSTDELKQILATLGTKVDIPKIADTLNSGLTKKSVGTVTNPTIVQDNIKRNITVDKKTIEDIKLQTWKIRRVYGKEASDKYIEDCKSNGLLPVDWPSKG